MTATVHVPYGDSMSETATLLLAAAEETENPAYVVVVDHFTNSFVVPEEVAAKAGLDAYDPDADFAQQVADAEGADLNANPAADEKFADPGPSEISTAPAKKTTAKKAAAKKTTAKKS